MSVTHDIAAALGGSWRLVAARGGMRSVSARTRMIVCRPRLPRRCAMPPDGTDGLRRMGMAPLDHGLEMRADGRDGGAHLTLIPPSVVGGERRAWYGDAVEPSEIDAAILAPGDKSRAANAAAELRRKAETERALGASPQLRKRRPAAT
jgi:hypothetical protein